VVKINRMVTRAYFKRASVCTAFVGRWTDTYQHLNAM